LKGESCWEQRRRGGNTLAAVFDPDIEEAILYRMYDDIRGDLSRWRRWGALKSVQFSASTRKDYA